MDGRGGAHGCGVDANEEPYSGKDRQFGGIHHGGCNVLFADGAVQFINESIEGSVFVGMAAIAAKEETGRNQRIATEDANRE